MSAARVPNGRLNVNSVFYLYMYDNLYTVGYKEDCVKRVCLHTTLKYLPHSNYKELFYYVGKYGIIIIINKFMIVSFLIPPGQQCGRLFGTLLASALQNRFRGLSTMGIRFSYSGP